MEGTPDMEPKNGIAAPTAASIAALVGMIAVLYSQGRVWWCVLGDYSLYVHEAWGSSHTSQHLFDPYSFTHVLHGVLFFWIAGWLFKGLSGAWRLSIAVIAEAAWEVLENTNFIIDKYRANTASLDYFGDSIANSAGDLLACVAGFWIAQKLGWLRSLVFFILIELVLLIWIRDGLIMNIIQLIYPSDALKNWQLGV